MDHIGGKKRVRFMVIMKYMEEKEKKRKKKK